jgi:CRISPR-associated exonuclease Cas4
MISKNLADQPRENYIPLSALNKFLFCPRQCALIHLEGEWSDNVRTLEGLFLHERVDLEGPRQETSSGVTVIRGLGLVSNRLLLTGKADVVEIRPDGSPFPIEYKRGRRKRFLNEAAQLCAQALCLEEMLERPVHVGAIYHGRCRRRSIIEFTPDLRSQTEEACRAMHAMLRSQKTPEPIEDARCEECSLRDLCLPGLSRLPSRTRFDRILFRSEPANPSVYS